MRFLRMGLRGVTLRSPCGRQNFGLPISSSAALRQKTKSTDAPVLPARRLSASQIKNSRPIRFYARDESKRFRYTTLYAIQAYASPVTVGNRQRLRLSAFGALLRSDLPLCATGAGFTPSPALCDVGARRTVSVFAFSRLV